MRRVDRASLALRSRGRIIALGALLAAPQAWGQGVLLRVHPRVGDTLHTRLEQRTEMTASLPDSPGTARKSVTTSVTLRSRSIVQASSAASTLVLTIVDSADLKTSDEHGAAQVAAAERTLRGQQLMLQLGADGTVEQVRDARGTPLSRDLADAMAAMPAVFPRRPVQVGEQWTRELPLPSGGPLGTRGSGRVNAVFRLDSLDRGGDLAYVSMRGAILPDAGNQGMRLSGEVSGAMQVDRQRGWMTDSRFTVMMQSLVTPPLSSGLSPMRFVTRVTQRLRTMDKR
jgi:hypothetical protein